MTWDLDHQASVEPRIAGVKIVSRTNMRTIQQLLNS